MFKKVKKIYDDTSDFFNTMKSARVGEAKASEGFKELSMIKAKKTFKEKTGKDITPSMLADSQGINWSRNKTVKAVKEYEDEKEENYKTYKNKFKLK